MRNYWLRIVLGAVVIFTVGMIGVTLARQGVGRVRNVVEGSGPISVPIAFIPFKLDGQKLGTVSKVVVQRDAPKQIASVELQIKLLDSTVARGLEGCLLAANLDKEHTPRDAHVRLWPLSDGVFTCLHPNDSTGQFQEFGRAVFQPGGVIVPLLLPKDIADDLQQGNFGNGPDDSLSDAAEAKADSAAEVADRQADAITAEAEKAADQIAARQRQFIDSLRREGHRREDSTRRFTRAQVDTARNR
jgi:cell division septum initiation protein DivIVA